MKFFFYIGADLTKCHLTWDRNDQVPKCETKRNNSKCNKTYFNETISWGNRRQKLDEKNREFHLSRCRKR
jgi:hypothetical protein